MTSVNYSIMLLTPFRYSMSSCLIFVLSTGEMTRKLETLNSVLSYWDKMNQQP